MRRDPYRAEGEVTVDLDERSEGARPAEQPFECGIAQQLMSGTDEQMPHPRRIEQCPCFAHRLRERLLHVDVRAGFERRRRRPEMRFWRRADVDDVGARVFEQRLARGRRRTAGKCRERVGPGRRTVVHTNDSCRNGHPPNGVDVLAGHLTCADERHAKSHCVRYLRMRGPRYRVTANGRWRHEPVKNAAELPAAGRGRVPRP